MKIKSLLLILLLITLALSGCQQVAEEPVEKTTGGVIIYNTDFPCGNEDDVCPENYGAECKVKDPDCE